MNQAPLTGPRTKWEAKSEYEDGTGKAYFQCQCPQTYAGDVFPEFLYTLCYMPAMNKMWFWSEESYDSESVRMVCKSWEQAEEVKAMLTMGKSHWMEEASK